MKPSQQSGTFGPKIPSPQLGLPRDISREYGSLGSSKPGVRVSPSGRDGSSRGGSMTDGSDGVASKIEGSSSAG